MHPGQGTSLGGREESWGSGEGRSLLEPSCLCRGVLLQRGAMEAAEEVHHTGPAGPGHGEARRRGADPGGSPMSGGGSPGDKRSAGPPDYGRNFSPWGQAGGSVYSTSVFLRLRPPCCLPESCHITLSASSFSLCVLSCSVMSDSLRPHGL